MILKATWDFWDGSSCRRSLKRYSCWMFVWIFHACGFLYTFSWDFYRTGSMLCLLMKNARGFLEIYHFAVKLTSFFSVTPERWLNYYIISISSIPMTTNNFQISSFCWIFFCLKSSRRLNINEKILFLTFSVYYELFLSYFQP